MLNCFLQVSLGGVDSVIIMMMDDDDDVDDDEGGDFYYIVGMMAEDAVDYDEKLLTCQLYPDWLSSMPFVPNERLFTTLKIIFVSGIIFIINFIIKV